MLVYAQIRLRRGEGIKLLYSLGGPGGPDQEGKGGHFFVDGVRYDISTEVARWAAPLLADRRELAGDDLPPLGDYAVPVADGKRCEFRRYAVV